MIFGATGDLSPTRSRSPSPRPSSAGPPSELSASDRARVELNAAALNLLEAAARLVLASPEQTAEALNLEHAVAFPASPIHIDGVALRTILSEAAFLGAQLRAAQNFSVVTPPATE